MCVLYAFGPEDIKASSPGNIALREELAKEEGSAESIEVIIIIMRGNLVRGDLRKRQQEEAEAGGWGDGSWRWVKNRRLQHGQQSTA